MIYLCKPCFLILKVIRSTFATGLTESALRDNRAALDYLPMMRCIAALDMSSQNGQEVSARFRVTRSRSKQTHFESLNYHKSSYTRSAGMRKVVETMSDRIIGA